MSDVFDKVQFKLRLPPALHASVKAGAERNGRSLNEEICRRLEMGELEQRLSKMQRDIDCLYGRTAPRHYAPVPEMGYGYAIQAKGDWQGY